VQPALEPVSLWEAFWEMVEMTTFRQVERPSASS
jgi:hypothetical protein